MHELMQDRCRQASFVWEMGYFSLIYAMLLETDPDVFQTSQCSQNVTNSFSSHIPAILVYSGKDNPLLILNMF